MKIDSIDCKIIEKLAENSALTATEIAKTVHLSVQSVTKRIEKIMDAGLIERYSIVVNPQLAGKPILAIVSIVLSSPEALDLLMKKIDRMEDVLSFYAVTGEYDYLIEMCAPTVEEFNRQLMEIKAIPGVQKTFTSFILDIFRRDRTIMPLITKQ